MLHSINNSHSKNGAECFTTVRYSPWLYFVGNIRALLILFVLSVILRQVQQLCHRFRGSELYLVSTYENFLLLFERVKSVPWL